MKLSHKRKFSQCKLFEKDIEKAGAMEDVGEDMMKEGRGRCKLWPIWLILLFVFLTVSTVVLVRLLIVDQELPLADKFHVEWENVLFKEKSGRGVVQYILSPDKPSTTASDVNLLDIDLINVSLTHKDKIKKLDDNVRKEQGYPASAPGDAGIRSHDGISMEQDMREIFLISPLTVLLNNEADKELSKKVLEILQMYTIAPEPQIVNLSRHPRCNEIMNYLREFSSHERLGDDAHELPTYNDIDIPRVFLGGDPLGDFNDIIDLYYSGALVYFLEEKGEGLISVS